MGSVSPGPCGGTECCECVNPGKWVETAASKCGQGKTVVPPPPTPEEQAQQACGSKRTGSRFRIGSQWYACSMMGHAVPTSKPSACPEGEIRGSGREREECLDGQWTGRETTPDSSRYTGFYTGGPEGEGYSPFNVPPITELLPSGAQEEITGLIGLYLPSIIKSFTKETEAIASSIKTERLPQAQAANFGYDASLNNDGDLIPDVWEKYATTMGLEISYTTQEKLPPTIWKSEGLFGTMHLTGPGFLKSDYELAIQAAKAADIYYKNQATGQWVWKDVPRNPEEREQMVKDFYRNIQFKNSLISIMGLLDVPGTNIGVPIEPRSFYELSWAKEDFKEKYGTDALIDDYELEQNDSISQNNVAIFIQ